MLDSLMMHQISHAHTLRKLAASGHICMDVAREIADSRVYDAAKSLHAGIVNLEVEGADRALVKHAMTFGIHLSKCSICK